MTSLRSCIAISGCRCPAPLIAGHSKGQVFLWDVMDHAGITQLSLFFAIVMVLALAILEGWK